MKVLVIGSGGREHALVWKIKQSSRVKKIFAIPGNAGIKELAECVDIPIDDFSALADFCRKEKIDWTIVGPEKPLVDGIVNEFEERGLNIFGPRKEAAFIEGSKVFAKEFMLKYNIPTAAFKVFEEPDSARKHLKKLSPSPDKPTVVKADGLAAGKGVIIAKSPEQGERAIDALMVKKIFGPSGDKIIIEEFLAGKEATLLLFSDGENILPLVTSQDHKKIYAGDKGPNTGGMGAYAPAPAVNAQMFEKIEREILSPTISGLSEEKRPYHGVLYIGLIITKNGAKVLEYNVRFGDPETQAVLPLLNSDLMEVLTACRKGGLKNKKLKWQQPGAAVCVILASKGYPGKYQKGKLIQGLNKLKELTQVAVFHAGTKLEKEQLLTSGGRVLGITAWDTDIELAMRKAYQAVDLIHFEGMQFRSDIGQKAIKI